ncbi:MAG: hypothetical protein ACKVY0_06975 [Prosthecobacter sp.]|uniref:hypothetical protein n=1 Tax=Prosthecobacter sp. TaxID=1965333 RepID=UPI0039023BCE
MSLLTLEVELDQGRVTAKGGELLPQHAKALLTILPAQNGAKRNPLEPHPDLQRVKFFEDPATPLAEDEWPEESR